MLNSPATLAIVAVVGLVVFGPKRLPELGKALGQALGNFKKSLNEAQQEVESAMVTDTKKDETTTAAKPEDQDPKKSSG